MRGAVLFLLGLLLGWLAGQLPLPKPPLPRERPPTSQELAQVAEARRRASLEEQLLLLRATLTTMEKEGFPPSEIEALRKTVRALEEELASLPQPAED